MRRRGLVVGLAATWGALAFLASFIFPLGLLLSDASPDERQRLLDIQIGVGGMLINLLLGGLLVYHATTALGGSPSGPARLRMPWPLLALFPAFVVAGQLQVNEPGRLPWLFPFVNLAMVSIPSLSLVAIAATRYVAVHPLAMPVTWRELSSGIIYGAVGATAVAAAINTLYIVAGGELLVDLVGEGGDGALVDRLRDLPSGWGIAFDLSALSVVAPLNEELWKGFLVALFFYRRGGVARCFLWGVLAGAGFNIAETFVNSLSVLEQEAFAEQTLGNQWWAFAVARAGTAAIHSTATGLAAMGFFGLLHGRFRYIPLFFAGAAVHAAWNFLAYVNYGDVFLAGSAPDAAWLDYLSTAAMAVLAVACLVLVLGLSRNLRDASPGAVYVALRLSPASPGTAVAGFVAPVTPPGWEEAVPAEG